jgi:D-alanyl-D-alanine carboxypeptidase
MKNYKILKALSLIAISLSSPLFAQAPESVMVVEAYSGKILLASNATVKRPVASLNIIGTAVVAVDWATATGADIATTKITVPQTVTDDINAAMQQVGALLATSTAANGTLVFASENSKTFTFPTPLASSTYRVQLTTDTFVPLRIAGQTTTSFTIQASATFTGTVGFDVFI